MAEVNAADPAAVSAPAEDPEGEELAAGAGVGEDAAPGVEAADGEIVLVAAAPVDMESEARDRSATTTTVAATTVTTTIAMPDRRAGLRLGTRL